MYQMYVAVVVLAAADNLNPEDAAYEFRALLEDLQNEQIKPLELLRMSRLEPKVEVNITSIIKAEVTV